MIDILLLLCTAPCRFLVVTLVASAPDNDADCLWQELQIMRKIRPHPHLVNLLGYSRETSSKFVCKNIICAGTLKWAHIAVSWLNENLKL